MTRIAEIPEIYTNIFVTNQGSLLISNSKELPGTTHFYRQFLSIVLPVFYLQYLEIGYQ